MTLFVASLFTGRVLSRLPSVAALALLDGLHLQRLFGEYIDMVVLVAP